MFKLEEAPRDHKTALRKKSASRNHWRLRSGNVRNGLSTFATFSSEGQHGEFLFLI